VSEFIEDTEDVFQLPEPPRRRFGRPSLIEDPNLHNRRDRLVQLFEAYWGEIGWLLRRIKKPDDLMPIIGVLEGRVWDDFLSVFWTVSSLPGTSTALSKIRLELRDLIKPRRLADEASRNAQERLHRARAALSQTKKRRERKLVRKEFAKLWKAERQASEEYKRLNERDDYLLKQLKLSEATFARREIFRFIKSKRYELNPLNLANAAAGLPFMAWRQSMRRCSRQRSISANGMHYQDFQAIRYLVLNAKIKTVQDLVQHFKTRIPDLPTRYRLPRMDLAEKWLFLERALRGAFRTNIRRQALPFEITARYFRQMTTQTYTDILLAERARIPL
jgi:hypothetical protein